MIKELGRSIVDLTKGDVLRELVAHAVIRMMTKNEFNEIEVVEYSDDDMRFIIDDIGHFVEAKINPLFADEFSKARVISVRPIVKVQSLILELFADGKERNRHEIDVYVEPRSEACTATVSNALKKLLDKGDVESPRFGWYKKKD